MDNGVRPSACWDGARIGVGCDGRAGQGEKSDCVLHFDYSNNDVDAILQVR